MEHQRRPHPDPFQRGSGAACQGPGSGSPRPAAPAGLQLTRPRAAGCGGLQRRGQRGGHPAIHWLCATRRARQQARRGLVQRRRTWWRWRRRQPGSQRLFAPGRQGRPTAAAAAALYTLLSIPLLARPIPALPRPQRCVLCIGCTTLMCALFVVELSTPWHARKKRATQAAPRDRQQQGSNRLKQGRKRGRLKALSTSHYNAGSGRQKAIWGCRREGQGSSGGRGRVHEAWP